ncbi:Hypothetical predicted protein [Xyrichtys novacula]|uniref:Uncharacterized protein n=1 Tax=Xyrichtys novacula TaxID=13765 RepID=A0AAV1GKW6_XYRNO|nr:Hypothetical predicted protein [Xyrichtys novacula]
MPTGSAEPEAVDSEMENITSHTTEEKGDESGDVSAEDLSAATNTTTKKKNKHEKKKKEIKEATEINENTSINRVKERSKDTIKMNCRQSNSLGRVINVDTSSITSYFQTVSLLQTKRPREVTSPSSESGTSSPAKKKVDTVDTGHQEAAEVPGTISSPEGEGEKGMDGEGARRKPGGLFA